MKGNVKTRGYRKGNYKKNKKNKINVSKTNETTIRQLIKKEIASNIENKLTSNVSYSNSVLSIDVSGVSPNVYQYYTWSPGVSGLFNIVQGVDVESRLGNKIKLKRWVIKGTLYYDPQATLSTTNGFSQSQGYVDVYFGRAVNTDLDIANTLDFLYQNGNQTITPEANIQERTYSINRDYYKIYWHKRFKVGASGGTEPNNDYKLNYEFGFDVCKMCTKNLVIKYDDSNSNPENGLLDSLYLFATFTCPNTNPNYDTSAQPATIYAPARIIATSYAEYEDA